MPINLTKAYNALLELLHLNFHQRNSSLKSIFDRDFVHNGEVKFRGKKINPIRNDETAFSTLFTHLTTHKTDTGSREFEYERSCRLHWLKHHILEKSSDNIHVFSSDDSDGIRTYIFDHIHNYVIVLAPYRNEQEYYLLTAYYLTGRNAQKINKKFNRRLPDIT